MLDHAPPVTRHSPPVTRRAMRSIVLVVALAALLRAWAVLVLPTDFDEPAYLNAAFEYAAALRAGDLDGIIDYVGNREHPALVKLAYAGAVLALGAQATPQAALVAARAVSAVAGTLAVLVLALAGGPWAGALLAVHTLAVKYTSQAYLEALPMLTATAAVLALARAPAERALRSPWLWASAAALGLSAAGKFNYALVAGVVVLYMLAFEKRSWRALLAYAAAAAVVFYLFNPSIWRAPVQRLAEALAFHVGYSQSGHVQQSGYPWYQPFVWLGTAPAALWHPDVFFYYGFDGFMSLLALAGVPREWRERRWLVVWLGAGLLFLLAWPTKWPQYVLVVVPAVCLAAAATLRRIVERLRELEAYWDWLKHMTPDLPRAAWVVLLLFVGFITAIYLWGFLGVALGSIGWSHLTTQNSLLPSNTIYAALALPDGRVVLGTERGAAVWLAPGDSLANTPLVYTAQNSGLPADRVLAVASDQDGTLWFGTPAGVAALDGEAWRAFDAADLGLPAAHVQALAVDGAGRVYAGTQTGAAVWDGDTWQPLTANTTGLADDRVFSLAVQRAADGAEAVWFGTLTGLSRLDTATGAWQSLSLDEARLSAGGVADLMVDSTGRLWAAALGGGVSVWDGQHWRNYTPANSGLPHGTVNAVHEVRPGLVWIAASLPTDVGGTVAAFDGETWRAYQARNSGFSGAEPLALAVDSLGRVWVGTRTAGVDIYELGDGG